MKGEFNLTLSSSIYLRNKKVGIYIAVVQITRQSRENIKKFISGVIQWQVDLK
jgi:hypothetical protein